MKGLPLAYNKDMQEDKEAIFDAVDNVKLCLTIFAPMLETMTVKTGNMKSAASKGFINATDCADYLTKKGLPFRDAYKVAGTLVGLCLEKDITLDFLDLSEYQKVCPLFEEDIYQAIDLKTCVDTRKSYGGPSSESVMLQTSQIDDYLIKAKSK